MRRTKIVCTLGPASEKIEILKEMIAAGMNVARLNLSHGTLPEHERRIQKPSPGGTRNRRQCGYFAGYERA